MRRGKKYQNAVKDLALNTRFKIPEAIAILKERSFARFDETLEIAVKLGVDPRHADQQVRGTVSLPHGTGKSVRVLVFAKGEKAREAEQAGADYVGDKELIEKIQQGWLEFDATISTPDLMREVSRLGKLLGPRGMMPSPKTGTVTFDVAGAVKEVKAGKIEFRTDRTGVVHVGVGKLSFPAEQLAENVKGFLDALARAKPSGARGQYIRSVYLSSSMSPGLEVEYTVS